MYAKLAWRNIRRSLRDYGIYFLTLVFAVAIFYVSNSLGDQPGYLALSVSTRRLAQGAVREMGWLSTIMTVVVALLVLYANRVIIKKRSRELALYLLLGMEQGRLALLLLAEITVIGLAALAVGLVSGIFLSQFFALIVNRIFESGLTSHPFVFSPVAVVRTIVCYGITFLLVGLWQAAAVYRQRLIDLITGARKNEEIRLRSRWLSALAALLALVTLGLAYWLSDRTSRSIGLSPLDRRILFGALLGIAGTYLLFLALAGLLTGVRRSGWLSRGYNLFLYRQVTSKINTHAILLATIALMLTFTICAMSTGLGLGRGIRDQADHGAPFDYLFFSTKPNDDFKPVFDLFNQYGVSTREKVHFVTAETDLQGRNLMLPQDAAWFVGNANMEMPALVGVTVLPVSAYQQLRALKGYPDVTLSADSYLIHTSSSELTPVTRSRQAFDRFLASGATVTLAGHALKPASDSVYAEPMGDQLTNPNALLVVPDAVAAALPAQDSYLAVQIDGQAPEALDQALRDLEQQARDQLDGGIIVASIRADELGRGYVTEGTLVFLAFYIGVMFILISATLLALQQVTDAVEHRQRFDILRKLGADERRIDGLIVRQVGLYFLTPVAVALIHSFIAMIALSRLFSREAGYTTVWPATLVTLGIFILIYGSYYLLSLQSCRALFTSPRAP